MNLTSSPVTSLRAPLSCLQPSALTDRLAAYHRRPSALLSTLSTTQSRLHTRSCTLHYCSQYNSHLGPSHSINYSVLTAFFLTSQSKLDKHHYAPTRLFHVRISHDQQHSFNFLAPNVFVKHFPLSKARHDHSFANAVNTN